MRSEELRVRSEELGVANRTVQSDIIRNEELGSGGGSGGGAGLAPILRKEILLRGRVRNINHPLIFHLYYTSRKTLA